MVPDNLKDEVWRRMVVEVISFADDCNMELTKRRGLQFMYTSFKNFKGELNKYVKNGTEPNWDNLPTSQVQYWKLAYGTR